MKKLLLSLTTVTLLASTVALRTVQAESYATVDDDGIHLTGNDVDLVDHLTVTITENEPLYDAASKNKRTGGSLAPQTVQVTALSNGFFRIKTWLGDKWIFPTHKIIYNQEASNASVALSGVTPMFDFPWGGESTVGELAPQTVAAFEKSLGGWYRIHTWMGDKWINPSIRTPLDTEKTSKSLELIYGGDIHQYPYETSKIIGTLKQEPTPNVTSIENTKDGWYRVQDQAGNGWVHANDSDFPKKVDLSIDLKQESVLYTNPATAFWLAKPAPQQVRAFEKWHDNSYKIHTWLGDAWIYVEPATPPR